MTLQVLVSTVNQKNYDLLNRMNIQSDAVVVNQSDTDSVDEFVFNGYRIKWISMKKKGVGLSRNTALSYADADIVLWSDDDMVYVDGYSDKVISAFNKVPTADIFCFNLNIYQGDSLIDGNYHSRKKKMHFWNCLRYGAPTIAARRRVVLKKNVSFSLIFGGGAEFSSGEDSLFVLDCIKKRMVLLTCPEVLANVYNEDSTWFNGYTEKFFTDKGVFYYLAFPHVYFIIYIYYAIRFSAIYKTMNMKDIYKLFINGQKLIQNYR